MGENFFSLQYYYNKKPLLMAGACDTYLTVYIYLRNTLSLVNMQSVSTVQNTISKPRLFMIFYWQKFFYLKNIQRSFLVRCRLGKLAFFNNASLATLAIILQNITAQRCSACHDGNPHAHNLINHCHNCDLVLYLTAHKLCSLCELTAHTVAVICFILSHKLQCGNCSNS